MESSGWNCGYVLYNHFLPHTPKVAPFFPEAVPFCIALFPFSLGFFSSAPTGSATVFDRGKWHSSFLAKAVVHPAEADWLIDTVQYSVQNISVWCTTVLLFPFSVLLQAAHILHGQPMIDSHTNPVPFLVYLDAPSLPLSSGCLHYMATKSSVFFSFCLGWSPW